MNIKEVKRLVRKAETVKVWCPALESYVKATKGDVLAILKDWPTETGEDTTIDVDYNEAVKLAFIDTEY
jgi:nicotinamide riboside kinase